MDQPEDKNKQEFRQPNPSKARKPYQPPQMRYERVFETMALSCGKVQTTQASCRFNRKAS